MDGNRIQRRNLLGRRTRRAALQLLAGVACLASVVTAAQAQDASRPSSAPQNERELIVLGAPTDISGESSATASVATPSVASAAVTQSADPANAAELEKRIHDLEALVQQMQTQLGPNVALPAAATAAQPDAVPPGPDGLSPQPPAFNPIGSEGNAPPFQEPFKGFYIRSPDKAFSLRFTGQIQADYREYLNTKDRTDIDTFLLRRARFGLEATLFQYYEFRFLPDFGQGTTIVQDAYMNVHYWDAVQFEIGRFKQPISYEQLIQDRYVPTLERSIIDQLVPARDLGAMVHGEDVFNNRLDYGLSVSNGEINGNSTDLNDHKDVDGRIAIRPLNSPDLPGFLHYFQVGVSSGFGIEQEAMSPATLKMPDTVPFLNFNSTVRADGIRTRLCPELAYFYGPFGFLAQYYDEHQDMRPSATGAGYQYLTDVPFTGYVFLATMFLTGETRTTWSEQIFPLRPFDPRCPVSQPGAWELVARVSRLDVGDVFNPGNAQLVNPAKNSNEAMEFTLGFNWYFNGWVRIQFNYEHDMFGQPVALGSLPENDLKSQDSVFTRFQIIF